MFLFVSINFVVCNFYSFWSKMFMLIILFEDVNVVFFDSL